MIPHDDKFASALKRALGKEPAPDSLEEVVGAAIFHAVDMAYEYGYSSGEALSYLIKLATDTATHLGGKRITHHDRPLQ